MLGGKRLHVPPEAVADLFQQRQRRDREAEVLGEEGDDLAANLELGDVGVQQRRSSTFTSKRTWPSSTSLMLVVLVVTLR